METKPTTTTDLPPTYNFIMQFPPEYAEVMKTEKVETTKDEPIKTHWKSITKTKLVQAWFNNVTYYSDCYVITWPIDSQTN